MPQTTTDLLRPGDVVATRKLGPDKVVIRAIRGGSWRTIDRIEPVVEASPSFTTHLIHFTDGTVARGERRWYWHTKEA